MDEVWWPLNGPATYGEDIPMFSHMDWYISRLKENRPHDLSHSGLQYDWSQILDEIGDISDLLVHPEFDGVDLRELVAERENIGRSRVVMTQGVTDAIHLALSAALPKDAKKVAVEVPAYAPVCHSARLIGLETVEFERIIDGDGAWRLDRDRLSEIIPEVDGIIFTPILNPTGFRILNDDLEWLVEATRMEGIPLLADEVYDDSMRESEDYSPLYLHGEHCVSMNSLTKVYGLGALRFGWIIANKEVAARAHTAFQTMNGMVAIPSARIAMAVWPHLDDALEAINSRRNQSLPLLEELLQKHGIEWQAPPYGLFGAINVGCDGKRLIDGIGKEEGLLAVPGCMFHKDLINWIRIAWSSDSRTFAKDLLVLDKVLSRRNEV